MKHESPITRHVVLHNQDEADYDHNEANEQTKLYKQVSCQHIGLFLQQVSFETKIVPYFSSLAFHVQPQTLEVL